MKTRNQDSQTLNKQKRLRRFFFKSKLRFFLFTLPLFCLLVGSAISGLYVRSVYLEWRQDHHSHLSKLKFYHHQLYKTVDPLGDKSLIKTSDDRLESEGINLITWVYDIKGRVIGHFAKEKRSLVAMKDISKHFINALLAVEDREFWHHNGINYSAITRAMIRNILALRFRQGGSTITQQLAKVLFTKSERTIKRKIYEMLTAKEIEDKYSKDEILLMYVNYIFFGNNVNGIEEAANLYFTKPAKDLNKGEATFIACIIANPTYFSPYDNKNNAKARHYRVLKAMHDDKYLLDDYKQLHKKFWLQHSFSRKVDKNRNQNRNFSHAYVMNEVRMRMINKLTKEFDIKAEVAVNLLYTKGWIIRTSIDVDLQRLAEQELKKGIEHYRSQAKKSSEVKQTLSQIQGALISISPTDGHIKAFVGGDRFTKNNQLNRVFRAHRQTGSAFKPLIYLAALENGDEPDDLIFDEYQEFDLGNGDIWKVNNYGNKYQEVQISYTEALKISSNQGAAQTILKHGVPKTREIVRRCLNWNQEKAVTDFPDYQYSIALGTKEMTPFELARLYSMIANQGKAIKPKLILSVSDFTQTPIYLSDKADYQIPVVSKKSADQITTMMSHVLEPGGTGSKIKKQAGINFDVVGKTGTSQKYRDLWFAGFTRELCTVVWLGHDENRSLSGGGGKYAGPIFGRFMKQAAGIIKPTAFLDKITAGDAENLIYEEGETVEDPDENDSSDNDREIESYDHEHERVSDSLEYSRDEDEPENTDTDSAEDTNINTSTENDTIENDDSTIENDDSTIENDDSTIENDDSTTENDVSSEAPDNSNEANGNTTENDGSTTENDDSTTENDDSTTENDNSSEASDNTTESPDTTSGLNTDPTDSHDSITDSDTGSFTNDKKRGKAGVWVILKEIDFVR